MSGIPVTRSEFPLSAAADRFESACATDTGCLRETNEDSVGVFAEPHQVLAVVADGMGGHQAGEVASALAVDVIRRRCEDAGADPGKMLCDAFHHAGRAIADAARDRALDGMGTTCTALFVRGGQAWAAHVGDSRLYLWRGGSLFRLTEDHSAVMELVRAGTLTPGQARHHEGRNVILRALGRHSPAVDSWKEPMAVRDGDCFLLCTDGLHDLVDDGELAVEVAQTGAEAACRRLIALARSRGGFDNMSVAVVKCRPPRVPPPDRIRETRESEVTG